MTEVGLRAWADLTVAAAELARARRLLGRHGARDLLALSRRVGRAAPAAGTGATDFADRVAAAIPRAARHVPWRADCFVQALAAQAWLARKGVPSDVWIGVRRDRGFEAHAWLVHDGRPVTGGDIRGFAPLVTPDTRL